MAYAIYLFLLISAVFSVFRSQIRKVEKDRNAKQALAEALISAQEEERKRIARDLHDGVGQSLLLIKKQMDNSSDTISTNHQLISDTLEEVRTISRNLHSFHLEKFGLTASIDELIQKIEQSTELFITKDIDHIDGYLPIKSEVHIYRTVQEIISNIVKHAEASAAKVLVKNLEKNIKIEIMDNGIGFDLKMAILTSKSLGIRTMNERVSSLGGQLEFIPGKEKGTTINMIIPKGNSK